MTPDELRAIGQGVYDAINDQDVDRLERLSAPGVVRHAAGEVGIGPALDAVRGAFAAAPDLRFAVEDLIADGEHGGTGDRVALRVSVHRGDTAPAMILEIFRVEGGQVAEIWGAGSGPG
jgi:predicted ester cyclase